MSAVKTPPNAADVFSGLMHLLLDAVAKESAPFMAHPVGNASTICVPESDESAMDASLKASVALGEVLQILNGIEQGIAGKPWPLHSALRTYIKHANSSLCFAMRDLRDFRSLINENGAHE